MYKQITFLFISLFLVYACSSETESNESSADSIVAEQTEKDSVEKNKAQEPFIIDYSDQYITFGHYREPIKLTGQESKQVVNFFKSKKTSAITYEIAVIIGEANMSGEEFRARSNLFVEDYYQSGENSYLFIRTFFGSGNGLSVLSINKAQIVSKIFGVTLDADSDGTYSVSSKFRISGTGQIIIDVNVEDYKLNETELNGFTIEQKITSNHIYKLFANQAGIFVQVDKSSKENSVFVGMERLESWTKEDLRILRNYIFAQNGYIFKSEDLSAYFKKFDWYEAKYTNVDDSLSKEDKAFVSLVSEIEKKK